MKLKNHDVKGAEIILSDLPKNDIATLLQIQLDMFVTGKSEIPFNFNKQINQGFTNNTQLALKFLTEGDLIFHNELGKDDIVFEMYQKALIYSIHSKEISAEILKRILIIVSQNSHLLDQYPNFLELYKEVLYDEYEVANYKLLETKYKSAVSNKPYIKEFKGALESLNNLELLRAKYYRMLGIAYDYYQNELDSAKTYHLKSKSIYDRYNSFYAFDQSYSTSINLAIVMNQTGDYGLSNKMLLPLTKSFIKKNKEYNRVLAYDWIADNYEKLSQLDSANFYLKRRNNLKDSLDFLKNATNVSYLQTKFETEKKEKQILEEQQRAQTNQNWLIVATLALVLSTGIAILVQKNTTKKRKLAEQETQLKQERVDNLLKQQELVSIDAMIEGQEKERQRVANELHDDLGSLMATIKLHFNTVKGKFKDPALHQAETLLEEAYQKVRGMAHSKNSGVMSDQGLLPAIKKMAQVITETNALQVTVEDFGMGDRLENSLELSLFRTVQELVANAIKHAEATRLNIQLTQHEDTLNIIVEDNGKGFDRTNAVKGKNGMGLTNIEKRIEHLEGHFTIDSVLGKGTSILIDIPI
ncbi:sensor histidine kinase [Maribacter confluentis]|uniref:Oxygen sensor histidine kinase NreB n=1 Tax=Maribacter confluentis TaxID=1656093 RepID=A0ABT8RQH3_9FLAO|nr:sensor histidine kinase [Maribacter confluentis]MDO1512863.1 sensor histidine kinase [Maribacter confluentis]